MRFSASRYITIIYFVYLTSQRAENTATILYYKLLYCYRIFAFTRNNSIEIDIIFVRATYFQIAFYSLQQKSNWKVYKIYIVCNCKMLKCLLYFLSWFINQIINAFHCIRVATKL